MGWALRFQKTKPSPVSLTLPAACGSWLRTLNHFCSTMPAFKLLCLYYEVNGLNFWTCLMLIMSLVKTPILTIACYILILYRKLPQTHAPLAATSPVLWSQGQTTMLGYIIVFYSLSGQPLRFLHWSVAWVVNLLLLSSHACHSNSSR